MGFKKFPSTQDGIMKAVDTAGFLSTAIICVKETHWKFVAEFEAATDSHIDNEPVWVVHMGVDDDDQDECIKMRDVEWFIPLPYKWDQIAQAGDT